MFIINLNITMANQKVYNIVINGIKESINELDILISKLDNIENRLDALGKQGIKLDTKGLKDLEKIKIPEISIEGIDAKVLKKEMQQLEKDIAKGAKTIDGEYTNTLNGLRAKLRDLKGELGTLDLDVDGDAFADLTDEIKELNDQVKQMEQDYGTFSRNVGNYTDSMVDALNEFDGQMYETAGAIEEVKQGVDSLKGKQMFDVNIGGVAVQFENVSQAIGEIDDMAHAAAAKMQQLAAAGKTNTEEYKKLNQEFNEFIQTSANLERVRKQTDELRDSVSSTSRGLDMGVQSFQALGNAMQMASGIAGLFGDNQEKIEEAINRTVQIQAILQAAQELYNQTTQKGTVLNTLYSATFGKISGGLTNMTTKLGLGTKAAKLFNNTLKANIFIAIATAILWVVTNLDKLSEMLGLTNEDTKVFTDLWNKISPVIMGVGRAITDWLINPIRTLTKTISKVLQGDWKGAFEEIGKGVKEQFNIIEDFQKGYADEVKAQAERATKKQKIELEKQLLHQKEFNEAKYGSDWKYTKDGIELYRKYFAAKLALYDKDSEEYRQALLEQISFERELKEHQENKKNGGGSGKTDSGTSERDLVQERRDVEDAIIAAMKDGFAKEVELLKKKQEREIEDNIKNAKLIEALEAKHQKEIEDLYKSYYDELANITKENEENITDYILANQKVRSENVLSELEYQLQRETELIQYYADEKFQITRQSPDSGLQLDTIKTPELPNIDFTEDLKKQFEGFKFDTSSFKGFFNSLGKIFVNGFNAIKNNIRTFYAELNTETLKEKLDKQVGYVKEYVLGISTYYNAETKQTESFVKTEEKTLQALVDITNDKLRENYVAWKNGSRTKEQYEAMQMGLEAELKYNKQMLDEFKKTGELKLSEQTKYIGNFIGKLYQEQAERRKIEKVNYEQSLSEQDKWLKNSLKQLSNALEKEINNVNLTEEEKKKIENKYQKDGENVRKQYQVRVDEITRQHGQNLLNIETDINNKRTDILEQYHSTNLKLSQQYFDKLNAQIEKNSNANDVDMGSSDLNVLGDISQFVTNKVKYEDELKEFKENITKQKDELRQQLKDGVISEDVFNLSMDNLNLLEEQTNETLSKMSKSFIEYSQSAAALAQAVVGIWAQMYSQIADLQYQNEMYRIEKLQEDYDKETELLQEKLEEQEELYEKHNQNVESIEGELETARGDRRLFLLDQINSEMMKREQAWAQQQKIAKQQEQLEKKKEQLEQRQKAAEQKRNKQQQKVQIAQATASTALAVTNALAVQPWFLGVALAAVAAAMGAVQIATIAKQKFADGGVIQGASHANGGVKVLNGQAEVEGGEYITNKVTTSKNVDVLTFINSKKRKLDLSDFVEFYSSGSKNYSKPFKTVFADGGQLPSMNAPSIDTRAINSVRSEDNRPIYVSVTEIENVQNKVRNVRAIAGLE